MKTVFLLILISVLFACNNSGNTTTKISPDSGGSGNTPGIENVNGNIPDTSAGIKLNKPLPKDSSRLNDSTHQ